MQQRELVPELMDDPNLDSKEHQLALSGLRRINFFSRTAGRIAGIIACHATTELPLRVLDLGCGGGDVTFHVWRKLNSKCGSCHVQGWDMSETAIRVARQQAQQQHSDATLTFHVRTALQGLAESTDQFDFIYCSLFLHHLQNADAIALLGAMRARAKIGVVVDDLKRTKTGYQLARLGCRFLSRSKVVHFDGPQSVRAAFTLEEVKSLAATAGMANIQLTSHWPQRFTLLHLCSAADQRAAAQSLSRASE